MAQWGWQKKWMAELQLRTDRKGVCPWCLQQMVCLCLCASQWMWHPLGIGEVFEHSFRGPRQISELCSSPPSGPGPQLTSVCMYVYSIEIEEEEHMWVSIAIVSISRKRTDLALTLRPPPRCCFVIATSIAGFENGFVYFFLFMLQSPPSLSTKFEPSSWLDVKKKKKKHLLTKKDRWRRFSICTCFSFLWSLLALLYTQWFIIVQIYIICMLWKCCLYILCRAILTQRISIASFLNSDASDYASFNEFGQEMFNICDCDSPRECHNFSLIISCRPATRYADFHMHNVGWMPTV